MFLVPYHMPLERIINYRPLPFSPFQVVNDKIEALPSKDMKIYIIIYLINSWAAGKSEGVISLRLHVRISFTRSPGSLISMSLYSVVFRFLCVLLSL